MNAPNLSKVKEKKSFGVKKASLTFSKIHFYCFFSYLHVSVFECGFVYRSAGVNRGWAPMELEFQAEELPELGAGK